MGFIPFDSSYQVYSQEPCADPLRPRAVEKPALLYFSPLVLSLIILSPITFVNILYTLDLIEEYYIYEDDFILLSRLWPDTMRTILSSLWTLLSNMRTI